MFAVYLIAGSTTAIAGFWLASQLEQWWRRRRRRKNLELIDALEYFSNDPH